jgi:hypothetical protein
MTLNAGTRLGPYEIVSPLGAGGMGEVFRARDTRLGRDVAVKVLPQHLSSNSEVRARFEREAKTVSSLNHPHICTLFDVGREGDTDYLVMELVEGETASSACRAARFPRRKCSTRRDRGRFDRAPSGAIHRDRSPATSCHEERAKLMDFGLARGVGSGGAARLCGAQSRRRAAAHGRGPSPHVPAWRPNSSRAETDAQRHLGVGCNEMATGTRAFEEKARRR